MGKADEPLSKCSSKNGRVASQTSRELRRRLYGLSVAVTGRDPFNPEVMVDVKKEAGRYRNLYQQLVDIDVEHQALEAELNYLNEQAAIDAKNDGPSVDQGAGHASIPELRSLEITISENKTLMEELKQKDVKWSENPLYVRLDNSAQSQSAAFEKLNKKLGERPSREQTGMLAQSTAQIVSRDEKQTCRTC